MHPLSDSAFFFTYKNSTLWIPFIITPSYLPSIIHPYYGIWVLFELLGHVFTTVAITIDIYIVWKANATHLNLQILNFYGAFAGMIILFTRTIFIIFEANIFSTNEFSDCIVLLSFVSHFGWVCLLNCVIYFTIERYMALKYSSDYETNKRLWISISLMAGNALFATVFAYLLLFNLINGEQYSLILFGLTITSCAMFSQISLRNVEENKKVASFHGDYTVSRRWQVIDNVRMAQELRIIIYGCSVQVSLYLPTFFLPIMLLDKKAEWVSTLELQKAIIQLVFSYGCGIGFLFAVFCKTHHREFAKSMIYRGDKVQKIAPVTTAVQSIDEYFDSLKNSWEMCSDKV